MTLRTTQKAILTDLADAVHGVASPFVCGGSVTLKKPVALRFDDGATVEVTPAERVYDQDTENETLVERCAPAKFGKGRRTRYDRRVRDAVQLNAAGEAFAVMNFDPESDGLLESVRKELAPAVPKLRAELHALNIYGRDGHFHPHKDTPRRKEMLGTLVVCLPSRFSQGMLLVMHRGAYRLFDWAEEIEVDPNPKTIRWAAFFGDVDHAIERLWGGSRVTLTYQLSCDDGQRSGVRNDRTDGELFANRFAAALSSKQLLPRGGVLAFPCFHMYSQERGWQGCAATITKRSATKLKGRDLTIARTALDHRLEVKLQPYLIETCADETWKLGRFPNDRERANLGDQLDPWVLDERLPLAGEANMEPDPDVTWVEPPPRFNDGPPLYPLDLDYRRKPLNDGLPKLEYLHACEYSATGYFGNEGGDTEFYLYAALHITIPPLGTSARPVGSKAWSSSKRPSKSARRTSSTM